MGNQAERWERLKELGTGPVLAVGLHLDNAMLAALVSYAHSGVHHNYGI